MKISNYEIPDKLFNEYVKWRIHTDSYVNGAGSNPSNGTIGGDHERAMRFILCSKKLMELHHEICKVIGVEYSEDVGNEFYIAFQNEVRKVVKLRG